MTRPSAKGDLSPHNNFKPKTTKKKKPCKNIPYLETLLHKAELMQTTAKPWQCLTRKSCTQSKLQHSIFLIMLDVYSSLQTNTDTGQQRRRNMCWQNKEGFDYL